MKSIPAHLNNVLLDLSAAIVLGRAPMHDAVVLEDGVNVDSGGRGGHVHDVDVDQLLVLALGVLQDDLVHAGLFAFRVDNVQLQKKLTRFMKDIFYLLLQKALCRPQV